MVLYEAEQLPIPNPSELSESEQERIREALQDLLDREAEVASQIDKEGEEEVDVLKAKQEERDELDEAVLATIGMEDRVDELKQAVEALVDLRREGSGQETSVLVSRTEEKEVIELEGVSEARESTRLTDF
jgi:F0F1-type ATP synthase delta subunit